MQTNNRYQAPAARVAVLPSRATFVRRRIMVLIVALLAVFATASVFQSQAQASSQSGQVTFQYVSVHPGDTLWTLADRYAGSVDHRDWIANLVQTNALASNNIQPGQRLALPQN